MNGCTRLSERMPDVALHRATWTPDEAAHLAACADCGAEWELMLLARRLEAHAPITAVPSALVTTLHQRLAEDRIARRRSRRAWSFAGAAALAAAILVAVATDRPAEPTPTIGPIAGADALVPLPELEGLGAAQLDTLLRSIDRPSTGSSGLDASTLGEHEDGELEQLFATWEG
jgi:hypothetical protein